jgi:hypothetical protein
MRDEKAGKGFREKKEGEKPRNKRFKKAVRF